MKDKPKVTEERLKEIAGEVIDDFISNDLYAAICSNPEYTAEEKEAFADAIVSFKITEVQL